MKAMVIFIEKKQKYIFLKKLMTKNKKQKQMTEKFEFLPFSFTYLVNGP